MAINPPEAKRVRKRKLRTGSLPFYYPIKTNSYYVADHNEALKKVVALS
jgi:hypothetical protein